MFWDIYTARPEDVASTARAIRLPDGWRAEVVRDPSDAEVAEITALNLACGVSSTPPMALRGEAGPVVNAVLRDGAGAIRASAFAHMIFADESPLAGVAFIGLVCADPDLRGQGLGRAVAGTLLGESLPRLGWREATAFIAPDNSASIRLFDALGFTRREGLHAAIATPGGARFTR